MKYTLFIWIIFFAKPLLAQIEAPIEKDSINMLDCIQAIERKFEVQVKYKTSWVEGLKVSKKALDTPTLNKTMQAVTNGTKLSFHQIDNEVFLFHNTIIILNPAFAQRNPTSHQKVVDDIVLFNRETPTEGNTVHNQLFKVGNVKNYQRGQKNTVVGYIKEKDSKEPVEGVFVFIQKPLIGTSTDANGFYTLTIPNGPQTLEFQSVNMTNTSRKIMLYSDGKLDVDMEVDVIALNTVVVRADREENVTSTQMGMTKIDTKTLEVVPALLGEKDLVKVATTTAGVQNIGEGSAGLNIRGGKADQNLFLLDGTTVYNTNHFFGFFSVFNSDALSGMNLYKSGIPAEFGGRLSSVFDIKTKDPETEKISVNGGIGVVTSRLMVEGPINKKLSFMVGGRATYSDLVLNLLKDSPLKNNKASFYDLVGKMKYAINKNNTLTATGYYSKDNFQIQSDTLLDYSNFSYSNALANLNWKHTFNNNLFADFQVSWSDYQYGIGYDVLPTQAFDINYSVNETRVAAKFDHYIQEKLSLKYGVEARMIRVNPGDKAPLGSASLLVPDKIQDEKGLDAAPYIAANFSPSQKVSFDLGLRYSLFYVLGPSEVSQYQPGAAKNENTFIGTQSFGDNEVVKTYHGPEIRFTSRLSVSDNSSIKLGYSKTRQNTHLIMNAASVAPTDIWRLSSAHIQPQVADQFSLGWYKNFYGAKVWETSAELYYKDIQNLMDFKTGAETQFNNRIETGVLQGQGRAYGLELSVKKSSGWLTGWFNYTYSRSEIQLDSEHPEEVVNGGKYYPTGYDKPHFINSITNYKFTRRFSFTLNLVYGTGVPITYPEGKWSFKSSENLLYSDRNEYRLPDYFRMDIGFNIEGSHKKKKLAHSSWNFSIYNVLGRDNIYSIFFKVEQGQVNAYKMSVFSYPVPTITYNFKF